MAITVRELVTKWGFKVNTAPLDRMNSQIASSKKLAKQTAIAIGAISIAFGSLLKHAGRFEQSQISFETMLGSAEKAKKILDDLLEFTLKTPFKLPGVIAGAKRLLAFGIEADKIVETLKALGDVSAGLSTDLGRMILNFGQVKTQFKLTGRELRDFSILGVPLIEELAKVMNKTTAEVQDFIFKGEVGFDIVEAAFKSMTSEGGKFFNLMQKQMKSLFGILTNVSDMFTQIQIVVGTKLLPEAKRINTELLNFLMVNKKIIELRLGQFLSKVFNIVGRLLRILVGLSKRMIFLLRTTIGLKNALKVLLGLLGIFMVANIAVLIGSITLAVLTLKRGIKILGNEALIAQAKMFLIPLAVGAAIVALIIIIDDLVALFKGDESLFGLLLIFLSEKLPRIKSLIGSVIDSIFQQLSKNINRLIVDLQPIFDLVNKFSFLGNIAKGTIGMLDNPIAPLLPALSLGNSSKQISISSPITINVPDGTPLNDVAGAAKVGMVDALLNVFRKTDDSIEDRGR